MNRIHAVRIGKRLQNKLERWDDELAVRGIEISINEVRRTKAKAATCYFLYSAMSYARDIWLFYSVSKEAIGKWPKIREWMKTVGFKREELITLGLSKALKPTLRKRKPTKKR